VIEKTNADGFAIVPRVFREDEIARVADALAAWPLQRSRAGARHLLACPAAAALALDPRLVAIAGEILQCAPIAFGATLFDKSASANWLVVWHQDTALPVRERREVPGWGPWSRKAGVLYAHAPASALARIVALRVHLDDATQANGPLRVLPRSHGFGVLGDDEIRDLATRTQAVACVVPRGGVVAMRPLIVHASSKTRDARPRRVLHIEYAATAAFESGLELPVTSA
jgi:ectoine hydroxylase-related dioxygenase (phytanoyl-CoA dioxygenase family)